MTPETFKQLRSHMLEKAPRECCGLIVDDGGQEKYIPCENTHVDPYNFFDLRARDYINASDSYGRPLAVCHSHPEKSCKPSGFDVDRCEFERLPYYIIGDDGLWRIDPKSYRESLIGRPFRFGWRDCFSLVRDYFGGTLRDYPRTETLARKLYYEYYEREGFEISPLEELRDGDVLMIKRRKEDYRADHAAVYIGEGTVLHHPQGRESLQETLTFDMLQRVAFVLRRYRES